MSFCHLATRYLYLLLFISPLAHATQGELITIAGGAGITEGGYASNAYLARPHASAVDSQGNTYITDTNHHRIRKVSPEGIITSYAGTGASGFAGDGGPALSAQLYSPTGLVIDSGDNLYVADSANDRIRKISPAGIITTIAGTGNSGFSGDGHLALNAQFNTPIGLALNSAGHLYIADQENHRIRKIVDAIVTTVAGAGTLGYAGDGGQALLAQLNKPSSIAVADSGLFYIADTNNNRIRKVAVDGTISTLAGTGGLPSTLETGGVAQAIIEHSPASQLKTRPDDLALDQNGDLYVADAMANKIYRINTIGEASTYAGSTQLASGGDGHNVGSAQFNRPHAINIDTHGNFYLIGRESGRVRKVNTSNIISTLAGGGSSKYAGDGGAANQARLDKPYAIEIGANGDLYFSDVSNLNIRKIDISNTITTIVSDQNFNFIDGRGWPLNISSPQGLAVNGFGDVVFSDRFTHRLYKRDAQGIVSIIAGSDNAGYGGDGSLATQAQLFSPRGIAVDQHNNYYIADEFNHRIRKIDSAGIITTIAGTGSPGYSGDNGLATQAQLDQPTGIAIDSSGSIYIADTMNNVIRKISNTGIISTIAGNGSLGFSGDYTLATSAQLRRPHGVSVDDKGSVFIADTYNFRIRQVDPDGIITTIAGDGTRQTSPTDDNGLATLAGLGEVYDIAIRDNFLYIPNHDINRIRRVELTPSAGEIKLNPSTLLENTDTSSAVTIGQFFDDGAGPYSYEITHLADRSIFQINNDQLQFKAGISLNYEQQSAYSVEITRTNSQGNTFNKVVGIGILNVNEPPIATIAIDGEPIDGQTLQANVNIQEPDQRSGAYTYQWQSNGVNVGNNKHQYIISRSDVGNSITVTISYTDNGGYFEAITSPATPLIQTSTNNPVTGELLITGLSTENQTLSLDTSLLNDIDGLGTFTTQWHWEDGQLIASSSNTYTLQEKDVGHPISATVTYIDNRGFYETTTATATEAIANVNDLPRGNVNILGIRIQGETLTALTSAITDDDGMGQFYFQWNRQGNPILNATSPTYQTNTTDVNQSLSVTVSYTDGHGTLETLTSAPTNSIVSNNQPVQGSLTISGLSQEGALLSLDTSTITDADGLGEFQYQWLRGDTIIDHTEATYQTSQHDVDHRIHARLFFTDGQGQPESVTSSATNIITNINNAPVGLVFISGTHRVGQALNVTADISDIDGLTPFSYQWLRNDNVIPDATLSSYVLTSADEGNIIHATIHYTDQYGTAEALSSAKTGMIETNNVPPHISGAPVTLIGEQQRYAFTPTAIDADQDTLSFSININLPAWLSFDNHTGELSGTPAVGDAARLSNIIISVSDGRYIVALDSFNLNIYADLDGDGIPNNSDADIDGDGMSNQYESLYGLNPENSADKLSDADNDGLNNFAEFLAMSNPILDDQAPSISPPADMSVDAEGLLTRVNIGLASATDAKDGTVVASSNAPEHFSPGQHIITWQSQDSAGNLATATQKINVNPLVEFASLQRVNEDQTARVTVYLNGDVAQYPVTLPYSISGTALAAEGDHDLSSGALVLDNPESPAQIIVNIANDERIEGTEHIIITLGTPTNAAIGPGKQHIIEIVEHELAPLFSLIATQNQQQTRTVIRDNNLTNIIAQTLVENNDNQLSYAWTDSDNSLTNTSDTAEIFELNPEAVSAGYYRLSTTVSSNEHEINQSLWVDIVDRAPVLETSADSDGDGINDEQEGYGDDNNNGIPNYLDGLSADHLIQQLSAQAQNYPLQAQPGLSLTLGDLAFRANQHQAKINLTELSQQTQQLIDNNLVYPADITDVEIHNTITGASVKLVIPQTKPLDTDSQYHVLSTSGQHHFIEDELNSLASTLGQAGICPPAGSSTYSLGLQPGHFCVQITVQDGGPNDRDGQNNGVISLTSGAAISGKNVPLPGTSEPNKQTPPSTETSNNNGGGALYLLIGLLILQLTWRHIYFIKQTVTS